MSPATGESFLCTELRHSESIWCARIGRQVTLHLNGAAIWHNGRDKKADAVVGLKFHFLEPDGRRNLEAQGPGDDMIFPLTGKAFVDHLIADGMTSGMHGGPAASQQWMPNR